MTIKIKVICEEHVPSDWKVEVVKVDIGEGSHSERVLGNLEFGESIEDYIHSGQKIEVREVTK